MWENNALLSQLLLDYTIIITATDRLRATVAFALKFYDCINIFSYYELTDRIEQYSENCTKIESSNSKQ